jgi:RNA recognition motif-containing protein
MAMKLFVGNLPFSTSDADLKELFSQAGEVASANVIMDKPQEPRAGGGRPGGGIGSFRGGDRDRDCDRYRDRRW